MQSKYYFYFSIIIVLIALIVYYFSYKEYRNIELNTVKVNINTANKDELTVLPGIGESAAESIVRYREKNGYFESIEDIMNVQGIKQNKFEKIKEYIYVE